MAMKAHVKPDPKNLRRLVGVVDDHLASLPYSGPALNSKAFEVRKQALRLIFADLAAKEGAAIRMAGVRATSTGGIYGALYNWIKAAQRKIAEAEAGKAGAT